MVFRGGSARRPAVLLGLAACVACHIASTPASSSAAGPAERAPAVETLTFEIREGHLRNYFYRRGSVAAHLLTTSGTTPRLIVAFPAGNSGVGVWFDAVAAPIELAVDGRLAPVERLDGLRGVSAVLAASVPSLRINRAFLGYIRSLREYVAEPAASGRVPDVIRFRTDAGPPVVLRRTTLDGHALELTLEPLDGASASASGAGSIALAAAPGSASIRMRLTALTDYQPLTPIPSTALLDADANPNPRDLQVLAFLSYRERLLAGSWRFLINFGRDTLMSVRLLMPVLHPEVIEAGLGSVLGLVSPDGAVIGAEEVGEYIPLMRRLRPTLSLADIYVYADMDNPYLLCLTTAQYLLETPAGRARAAGFLARRTPDGRSFADALRRNLQLVVRLATPFAESRRATDLVALREGAAVGMWRDSADCASRANEYRCNEGLGNGRIPFAINVGLVPAALRAAERLYDSSLLGPPDPAAAARVRGVRQAWTGVGDFFRVEVPAEAATARLQAYAREQKLDPTAALASVRGPVAFSAIALRSTGEPVPVMHTDDGFTMLFDDPSPGYLEQVAANLLRPFPAGLTTPVGVLVANPAYVTDPAIRAKFTRGHYHGTVVWSWQQALLAAGLERQLARRELPPTTLRTLRDAQAALWKAIRATDAMRLSELWTFSVEGDGFRVVPFGQGGGDVTESNAAQLWSTVYLALTPPSHLEVR